MPTELTEDGIVVEVARPVPLRGRWQIGWLLGVGVLVNYFDRVNLSVSHDALVHAFGISAATFGLIASAYNWTYAACQLPVGVVLDRFGVKRVGRLSILVWAAASFAASVATGVRSFVAARLLLGVGEAPTFPANAKAVGRWFPLEERSMATAMSDAAAKFASAIGVPLIGLLLLQVGWRLSFAATGLLSLAYFVLFWKVYRDPIEDARISPEEIASLADAAATDAPAATLPYLLRKKKVLGLALGFGSYNYVFYLLLTWLPSYLSAALGVDLLHSFLYTGVPWLVATITDFGAAWMADELIRRGWDANRVRRTILVVGTACGLGIVGAGNAHTPAAALAWISLSIGGLSAAAPIGWSVPALIAPRGSTATVGGIVNFSCQISGIVAPIVTGFVVQRTHSFVGAFAVAGGYLVVGICAYIWMLGRIEPVPAER